MSDDEVEVIRAGYRRFLTWGQRSPDFAVALPGFRSFLRLSA